MTASPPKARTFLAISVLSVATLTRPRPAAAARRQTCTIIGRPLMSASGLPGRRVACMRAGIKTSVRVLFIIVPGWRKVSGERLLIRVAFPPAKQLVSAPRRTARAEPGMDSFELNKIAGAVLGTALLVMALSITSEIIYAPPELETAAYVIEVPEGEAAGAAPGGQPDVAP